MIRLVGNLDHFYDHVWVLKECKNLIWQSYNVINSCNGHVRFLRLHEQMRYIDLLAFCLEEVNQLLKYNLWVNRDIAIF